MSEKLTKVKLKGNESFNIREGWLRKGMRSVATDPSLFSREDAMEILGVGSKMVKSIRFWLQATSLTKEEIVSRVPRKQHATYDFGAIIAEFDPYFEDIFTLWLIHSKIVKNDDFCMAWSIFFNEFEGADFSREDFISFENAALQKKMGEGSTFSDKSLADDCNNVIKMYLSSKDSEDPEENLGSPFDELRLIQKSEKKKNCYNKAQPNVDRLDRLAILYVIMNCLEPGKSSVSIEELLTQENNIGRIFNLNRMLINEYLDQLRIEGYITINRTAGLDMVYIERPLSPQEIMRKYYKQ